jgi:hypothetical protein
MATGLFTLKQVNQAIRQGAWSAFNPPQFVEYLCVAGGGSGASSGGTGGSGGGAGGSTNVANTTAVAGRFGGGGGGGGNGINLGFSGGAGAQGAIIIVYTVGGAPTINSNFFFLFG